VSIGNGVDVMQGGMEEWLQVIFFFASRDGGDDLIEIEVDKKVGRGKPFVRNTGGGLSKSMLWKVIGRHFYIHAGWGRRAAKPRLVRYCSDAAR
jgi:hypothetical protein